jgi:DNA-binding XRE family transcriptional regulator
MRQFQFVQAYFVAYNGIKETNCHKGGEKMTYIEIVGKLPWYKKIAVLRAVKGLNQEQAAEICGTTRKHFYRWEQGKAYPRENSKRAIARAFELPVEEIFG